MGDRKVKVNQRRFRKVIALAQSRREFLQISLKSRCLDFQEGEEAECQAVPSAEPGTLHCPTSSSYYTSCPELWTSWSPHWQDGDEPPWTVTTGHGHKGTL